jgi:hypothetical protein
MVVRTLAFVIVRRVLGLVGLGVGCQHSAKPATWGVVRGLPGDGVLMMNAFKLRDTVAERLPPRSRMSIEMGDGVTDRETVTSIGELVVSGRFKPVIDRVGADNLARAGQAACSYSWRSPPSRSCLRMLRWVIWSGSVIGRGSGCARPCRWEQDPATWRELAAYQGG